MNFPLLMLLTAARWLNGQKNAHNQVYRASALVLPKGRKQRPRRMMNWSLILSYVKKLSMLSFWGTLHCQWTHPPEPHESALCCSELHSDSTVTQVCTNTGSCSRYVIYCNSTKTVILRFLLLEVSKEFFSWFDVTDLWYLFVWKFSDNLTVLQSLQVKCSHLYDSQTLLWTTKIHIQCCQIV